MLEFRQCQVVTNIIAFSMSNGNAQYAGGLELVCKWRFRSLDPNEYMLADKMQIPVSDQRPGQKTGFAKYLKAIADAQHQPAALRKLPDRIHYRRKTRQGSGAQIIAVRKTAGDNHCVVTAEVSIPVPDKIDRLAHVL